MWVVFVAVSVAWLGVRWHLKQRRRSELRALALAHGLAFSPADHSNLLALRFRLFRKGDGRGIDNVLSGTWQGQDFRAFDYWYYDQSSTSNGGNRRTYHRFSCVVFDIEAYLPDLEVTREGPFSRVADHVGFRDLDFESEEFNRKFQVWAPVREFAYEFIDARVIRLLLSLEANYCFETSGSSLLMYRKGLRVHGFVPLIGAAVALRKRIPRVVWNLYGVGRETASPPAGPPPG